MYKVIIVDDEIAARNGFSIFVKKVKSNFEVVETFADGKEAIEYLESNDVDVVITDIRMMEISGIEVAKFIYENKPYIKVILVSAYKDFEYAYSAVEYGVSKILIKPVSYRDFSQALLKIEDDIKSKETEVYEFNLTKLEGNVSPAIDGKIIPGKNCMIVNFPVDKFYELIEGSWNYGREGFYRMVNNFLNDYFAGSFEFCLYEHEAGNVKYLAYSDNYENDDEFEKALASRADKIRAMLEDEFGNRSKNIKKAPYIENDANNGNAIIDRVKQYIEKHYNEDISLYDLGESFNVNSAYLSRTFKRYVGMGFSDYLTYIRMENAKRIILEGKYKVDEVAKMTGYPNSSYFSRVFKNYTGCAPKTFYMQEVIKKDEE